ncbi:amino acid ABC transporter permease [Paraburkholderia sacchari]|uniref:amino acid ABC transporter permease n=1 Tax=Paraburkholderia sacchari TaxID=159450 RepID=UPI00054343C2|nr:amino acid ABC transporter permease [Paraburkholderia sacchari]NLP60077.1 amino acid ABC transporter permease [Paraburkholderia sacchari]
MFWDYVFRFVQGIGVTLELSFCSVILAFVVGVLLAIMRICPSPPLRCFAWCYVEAMRATPILALLVMIVWGLPKLGFMYSEFSSSVLALGLYTAAWISEAIRAGVGSIATGQIEAARSVGMSFAQILHFIVIPQAVRSVIPSLSGIIIVHIKTTSIAAVAGVLEITATSQIINVETAQWLWFLGAAASYLVLTVPTGWIFKAIEQRAAFVR